LKIILIGSLPPPVNGAAMAFKTICDAFVNDKNALIHIIDLGFKTNNKKYAQFTFARFHEILYIYLREMRYIPRNAIMYITISQSLWGFLKDTIFIVYGHLRKNRIVIHLHGGNFKQLYDKQTINVKNYFCWVLNKVNRIIVLSELFKEQFSMVKQYELKVVVVPNGVPPISYQKKTRNNTVRLLYVSNLIKEKGIFDVLLVVKGLKDKGYNIMCDIAGEFQITSKAYSNIGELKDDFYKAIDKLKIKENIKYHGLVLGEEKEKLFRESHIFIFPTYYPFEGQPICILEAMNYGLPIISTQFRTIPEIVEHGINGFLSCPHDVNDFIINTETLINNNSLYEQISQQNHKKIEDQYSEALYVTSLKDYIVTA
jgi:glycosyltransferase involved in cell wall biosynthesis